MHLYYTLNNKRPDPFQAYGEKFTRKFDYPFTLSPGKKTIKVMAMAADKSRESSVVTRTFIVHEGEKKDKDADVSLVLIDVHVLSKLKLHVHADIRHFKAIFINCSFKYYPPLPLCLRQFFIIAAEHYFDLIMFKKFVLHKFEQKIKKNKISFDASLVYVCIISMYTTGHYIISCWT